MFTKPATPYSAPEVRAAEREQAQDRSQEKPPKRKAPRIGFLRPAHIERAFVILLYATMALLIVLSVLGTFYGLLGQSAPLLLPRQLLADVTAGGNVLLLGVTVQAILSITQYGARQLARHDRRWWLLYLATLAISVYYNVQAYWEPLTLLMASPLAGLIIVAGDVLPEFLAVRRE